MNPNNSSDEKSECRLYIGNIDTRITEYRHFLAQIVSSNTFLPLSSIILFVRAALIKMFTPFGKIMSEDYLWHTRGPKRGDPRGYAFMQFSSKEEARLAKENMHGRLVSGRPLVVRLVSEKDLIGASGNSSKVSGESSTGSGVGKTSRSAKIAAIKNKLKTMEEDGCSSKKKKLPENPSSFTTTLKDPPCYKDLIR